MSKSPREIFGAYWKASSRQQEGNVPLPPVERAPWLVAISLLALGIAVVVTVACGVVGRSQTSPQGAPPPVLTIAATPIPGSAEQASFERMHEADASGGAAHTAVAIVTRPSRAEQSRDKTLFEEGTSTHISKAWMSGFYSIYATAQHTFGVNWLLLASIHRQESAFSTAPGIYHGLNFAGCCGGPMQFNVTNGPVSTWDMVADSYIYGKRPASYDHMTAKHPSIYDDFDAIMAAAHLLSADGAGFGLEGAAWDAAYDYYGHDATGVTYADQVLSRAIGWSQHGFCINCGSDQSILEAVHAAYGAPVLAALQDQSTHAVTANAKHRASSHKR